jgi:hypothetical protein
MIAMFIPLARWVERISSDNLFYFVLTFVLYLGITVVLGAFIYFISYIPFNLSTAFDPIKNDIASGRINTIHAFGEQVTEFVTGFFDFSFLDIEYAVFQSDGSEMISTPVHPELMNTLKEFDLLHISKQGDEIVKVGKLTVGDLPFHLYLVPIWFGEQWLGYLALLTPKTMGPFFRRFIQEFENNYIDDQLVHVLNSEKRQSAR